MPKDMRTEKHHQNDFAILGRTYGVSPTCCLWNATVIISNFGIMSSIFPKFNIIRKCYRKTRRMKQSFGLYFFPGKGVRVMACKYLDFQDRKKIAKMYQEEARVLDIAYKIGCHPATIYEELRRGDTGKLDKNQRPEYDPRLAQRTFQEAIRRRGNRRTTTTAESGQ